MYIRTIIDQQRIHTYIYIRMYEYMCMIYMTTSYDDIIFIYYTMPMLLNHYTLLILYALIIS